MIRITPNNVKTAEELAWEFIEAEVNRQANEPGRLLKDAEGREN
jgi:hypothetical protein